MPLWRIMGGMTSDSLERFVHAQEPVIDRVLAELRAGQKASHWMCPDHLKFRSSMTLFAHATEDNRIFLDALRKYFDGQEDTQTLERL